MDEQRRKGEECVLYLDSHRTAGKEGYARFEQRGGLWYKKGLEIDRPAMLGLKKEPYRRSVNSSEKCLGTILTESDKKKLSVIEDGIIHLMEIYLSVFQEAQKTPVRRRDYDAFGEWIKRAWNKTKTD